SIFAANNQKTYLMSDKVWQKTNRLCIMNGVLGPAPVSPTTGENILRALNRLNYNSLSSRDKKTYDEVIAELESATGKAQFKGEDYAVRVNLDAALEGYMFNHQKDTYLNEFFLPYQDRPSLLGVGAEIFVSNNLYLNFRYDLRDNYEGYSNSGKTDAGFYYKFSNFSYFISPLYTGGWETVTSDTHNMFNSTPLRAGASLGNKNFNFFIGRNGQSFGNGQTGNLIISDTLPYQEFIKFEASTNFITYELSLTHFDNTQTKLENAYNYGGTDDFTLNGEHQNRTMQRIDLNFSNRVRFAMNIGGIYNTDSPLDWRLLMPMAIVHNWENMTEDVKLKAGDEGNNIMGFEFEYVLKRGTILSAQLVIDQFRIAIEKNSKVPNAFGFLANITKLEDRGDAIIQKQAEFIFTNPYLYLNSKTKTVGDTTYYHWGYDFIVGYAYAGTENVTYSGHPYGPGTIALNLRKTYFYDKGSQFAVNALLKFHGNKGIDYGYEGFDSYNNQFLRKTNDETLPDAFFPLGTVETTFRIDIGYSRPINKHLSARIQGASITQWNYHNVEGEFKQSFQGALGIKWVM
ncbi:MAG: hypothetical protein K6G51_08470, partial [Sphaerochaetaceae bacterium]|nr:hypothetical protein [Sphaerochaetaceae bacterium]